jgi:hypothetical protein
VHGKSGGHDILKAETFIEFFGAGEVGNGDAEVLEGVDG